MNKNFTGTLAVIFRVSVNSFVKFHNYDCKQCPKLYWALNNFKIQREPVKYKTQGKAANSIPGKTLKLTSTEHSYHVIVAYISGIGLK